MTAALLTLTEVAARLGISRTSAWRMVKGGVIPSIELLPGLRRVDPSDLEAFLDSRRTSGPSAKVVELRGKKRASEEGPP